jgi:hypothetical protein
MYATMYIRNKLLGYIPEAKQKTFLEENHEYISPIKTRFLGLIENSGKLEKQEKLENKQIDPIFYDKKQFTEYMMESNTPLEKEWRTRILLENTPRGNIIMFYDAFKLGFSFYCDQKVISYDVLNAAAMKYVTVFQCRHFFIDEAIVPKEHTSPLIQIHFTEETTKTQHTKEVKKTFAKLRDYTKENPNAKTSQKQQQQEPEKRKNIFLYLGKLNNFQILQSRPKTRKVLAKFTSPLLETLQQNTNVQRETLSYKQFRAIQKETTQADPDFAAAPAAAPTPN